MFSLHTKLFRVPLVSVLCGRSNNGGTGACVKILRKMAKNGICFSVRNQTTATKGKGPRFGVNSNVSIVKDVEKVVLEPILKEANSHRSFQESMFSGSPSEVCSELRSLYGTRQYLKLSLESLVLIEAALVRSFMSDINIDPNGCVVLSNLLISTTFTHDAISMSKKMRDSIEHFIVHCNQWTVPAIWTLVEGLQTAKFKFHDFKPETQAKLRHLFLSMDHFKGFEKIDPLSGYLTRFVDFEVPKDCFDMVKLNTILERKKFSKDPKAVMLIVENLTALGFNWSELPPYIHELVLNYASTLKDLAPNQQSRKAFDLIRLLNVSAFDCEQTPLLMKVHGEILQLHTAAKSSGLERSPVLEYFEFLWSSPEGKALFVKHRGVKFPEVGTNVVQAMPIEPLCADLMDVFEAKSTQNVKIASLNGLMCQSQIIDCAVFINNKAVAFIVIDGDKCYTKNGELNRVSQFRDFLYARKFPGVGLYRMKRSEIHEMGQKEAAELLCGAILEDLELKKM